MTGIRAIAIAAKAALLVSLCLAPAPLASQKKQMMVAIMEPSGDAGRMDKSTLRGAFEEFVTNSKGYRVVDRARADQVFGELNLQRENVMMDPQTAKAIGKHLGADLVCASEIIKEEGYSNINVSLINVETGVVQASGSRLVSGGDPRAISDAAREIAAATLRVKK
jgi:PBP1b-binding outer membrane lipoprotein LpoB